MDDRVTARRGWTIKFGIACLLSAVGLSLFAFASCSWQFLAGSLFALGLTGLGRLRP